jgi:cbb3-type cytochrome oxidase subunit 3
MSDAYRDSLLRRLPPDSELCLSIREAAHRDAGQLEAAFQLNDMRLSRALAGTPEHALVTFHRSVLFHRTGNEEKEIYYLTLSALSDVQSAIKDHASLWTLAQLLYEKGDIERAYRYIRFSWDETNFYNTRLRSMQSAGILSLIDKTYQAITEKHNHTLQRYLLLISTLTLLLIAAVFYIYRQMKRLRTTGRHLKSANGQLELLNDELSQMNSCLQHTNLELSESNLIKEEYIARFIKLCSVYIDKLDAYRRMVSKKLIKGQQHELLEITRSPNALDSELDELYTNFDTAFLHLFPDFVNKFNALLQNDGKIVLKKEELLNTELRIFALIRLGIDDSSQIAEFLRYSVNTIYNYRAKVKNKARIQRDDFENQVKMIR